jgi:hypothetical protein
MAFHIYTRIHPCRSPYWWVVNFLFCLSVLRRNSCPLEESSGQLVCCPRSCRRIDQRLQLQGSQPVGCRGRYLPIREPSSMRRTVRLLALIRALIRLIGQWRCHTTFDGCWDHDSDMPVILPSTQLKWYLDSERRVIWSESMCARNPLTYWGRFWPGIHLPVAESV